MEYRGFKHLQKERGDGRKQRQEKTSRTKNKKKWKKRKGQGNNKHTHIEGRDTHILRPVRQAPLDCTDEARAPRRYPPPWFYMAERVPIMFDSVKRLDRNTWQCLFCIRTGEAKNRATAERFWFCVSYWEVHIKSLLKTFPRLALGSRRYGRFLGP